MAAIDTIRLPSHPQPVTKLLLLQRGYILLHLCKDEMCGVSPVRTFAWIGEIPVKKVIIPTGRSSTDQLTMYDKVFEVTAFVLQDKT